jgi:uncharacterized phage protein (TIGR01671 family)
MDKREIKFRAWDGATMHLPEYSDENEDFYISVEGEVKFFRDVGWDNLRTPAYRKDWALMQFTGLRDKEGKEIYEGDVIRTERQDWGVIVWRAPFFEVTVSADQSSLYSREWFAACEVTGNIYENPGLLEK